MAGRRRALELLAPPRVGSLLDPDLSLGHAAAQTALHPCIVSIADRLAALRTAAFSAPVERSP